jgi:hypothetical protein
LRADRESKECKENIKYLNNLLRGKSEEIKLMQDMVSEAEAEAQKSKEEYLMKDKVRRAQFLGPALDAGNMVGHGGSNQAHVDIEAKIKQAANITKPMQHQTLTEK